ncbi:MAG: hypothetical protein RI907_89 [Pseudomonadota bacterium]|jgi:hypothetical protein
MRREIRHDPHTNTAVMDLSSGSDWRKLTFRLTVLALSEVP